MRAVILQHVEFEGPGAFATALHNRGVSLEPYLVPKEGLPQDAGDLLIVMGGPMSVNDSDRWITEETAFIRSVLLAGNPVIGVCLGSQFMAKALGATVRSGMQLELGMTTITATPEASDDPFFKTLPRSFDVFEWHGEIYDLPSHCVTLARSSVAPLQAFRYGLAAYGLLFHIEMEPAGIDSLCRECAPDLIKARLTAQDVKASALPHLPVLHQFADRLIGHLSSSQR
ncbi:Glutamine amidotransferase [Nitrospira sp. KM1]|uniref:type 1 glutamine amidotransferase n=1 Tax=Nitrospira sp. KM1 TaxID=1936990 RepID=UPI0013A73AE0|nr:type 1 glutamine amidotransferase [Nitrospira sp. KM1]BCA55647.1 Glutamine amidotransferase [Nitrospira sp. KM1]